MERCSWYIGILTNDQYHLATSWTVRNLKFITTRKPVLILDLFENDLYEHIDLTVCVEKRVSEGGTSTQSVMNQIAYVRKELIL